MKAFDIKTGNSVPRQKNPVRPESWLMPGGCTDVEPPQFNQDTHSCSFDGSKWVLTAKTEPNPERKPHVKTYAGKRREEYGSVQEQIEFITEKGLESWQKKVTSIKEKYPKPS